MHTPELLNRGLKELGFACTGEQMTSFMTFLFELKKWNRAYNLTALKTDEDIIIKHFLDSLLYLKAIPEGKLKLADAGTGAGFPGVPLKIMRPETEIALIESSGKKTAFLRHITRQLGLTDTAVIERRLENLGKEYQHSFDLMVSRAAFSVSDFFKKACSYVKDGGRLVLNKGPRFSDELKEMERACTGKIPPVEVINAHLPLADAQRNLIVLSCKIKP
ncbi:MAG: 16S rRNA (guanine(527)-N(7))-methyltransferase RsmG [Nitrospirota bacterium]